MQVKIIYSLCERMFYLIIFLLKNVGNFKGPEYLNKKFKINIYKNVNIYEEFKQIILST